MWTPCCHLGLLAAILWFSNRFSSFFLYFESFYSNRNDSIGFQSNLWIHYFRIWWFCVLCRFWRSHAFRTQQTCIFHYLSNSNSTIGICCAKSFVWWLWLKFRRTWILRWRGRRSFKGNSDCFGKGMFPQTWVWTCRSCCRLTGVWSARTRVATPGRVRTHPVSCLLAGRPFRCSRPASCGSPSPLRSPGTPLHCRTPRSTACFCGCSASSSGCCFWPTYSGSPPLSGSSGLCCRWTG